MPPDPDRQDQNRQKDDQAGKRVRYLVFAQEEDYGGIVTPLYKRSPDRLSHMAHRAFMARGRGGTAPIIWLVRQANPHASRGLELQSGGYVDAEALIVPVEQGSGKRPSRSAPRPTAIAARGKSPCPATWDTADAAARCRTARRADTECHCGLETKWRKPVCSRAAMFNQTFDGMMMASPAPSLSPARAQPSRDVARQTSAFAPPLPPGHKCRPTA